MARGKRPREAAMLTMWLKMGTAEAMMKAIRHMLNVQPIQVPQWTRVFCWRCLVLPRARTKIYLAEMWHWAGQHELFES